MVHAWWMFVGALTGILTGSTPIHGWYFCFLFLNQTSCYVGQRLSGTPGRASHPHCESFTSLLATFSSTEAEMCPGFSGRSCSLLSGTASINKAAVNVFLKFPRTPWKSLKDPWRGPGPRSGEPFPLFHLNLCSSCFLLILQNFPRREK